MSDRMAIDKLATLEKLKEEAQRYAAPQYKKNDLAAMLVTGLLIAIETVWQMPGVEPRPHGQWEYDKNGRLGCSVCGWGSGYNEAGEQIRTRYCPCCGAQMDGEEQET